MGPSSPPPTAAPASDPLERELLALLQELFGQMRLEMRRALAPLGLPAPHARALRSIDGVVSMKELGRRMQCDPSFVTSVVDALEQRGLVERRVDLGDRRVKILVLTEAGVALRQQLDHDFFGNLRRIRSLDGDERRSLLALLTRLVDHDRVLCEPGTRA